MRFMQKGKIKNITPVCIILLIIQSLIFPLVLALPDSYEPDKVIELDKKISNMTLILPVLNNTLPSKILQ